MDTADQVTTIIDKLSEKVGLAADKLAPIASDVIRQTQTLGMVETLAGGILLIAGILVLRKLINVRREALQRAWDEKSLDPADDCLGHTSLMVVAPAVMWIVSMVFLCEGLIHWIAPLPHLLKL